MGLTRYLSDRNDPRAIRVCITARSLRNDIVDALILLEDVL
jgi:hypothetical protein